MKKKNFGIKSNFKNFIFAHDDMLIAAKDFIKKCAMDNRFFPFF